MYRRSARIEGASQNGMIMKQACNKINRFVSTIAVTGLIGLFPTWVGGGQPHQDLLADIKAGRATFEQVLPWLDTDEPDLQRLLLQTVARKPEWERAAAQHLRNWLKDPQWTKERASLLTGLLQTFADQEEVQAIVARAIADSSTERRQRLQMLRCLARTRNDPLPGAWLEVLHGILKGKDELVCQEAVFTVKSKDARGFEAGLRRISEDENFPIETRVAAIEYLATRGPCAAAAFRQLRKQMKSQDRPLVSAAAARALGKSRLSSAQLQELVQDFSKIPASSIALLLPAFSKSKDSKVGLALVAALVRLPSNPLSVGEWDRALAGYPNELRRQVRRQRESLLAQNHEEWKNLMQVARESPVGDAKRGKLIFQSDRARCATCHRAASTGCAVGPNLSRIGVIRSRTDLLESIVIPDAYIAPEFRTYTVTTTSGRILTGQLLQETTTTILLRTISKARIEIERGQIEDLVLATTSLMPRGFEKVLTRQELSDVVEFLVNQR